MKILLPFHSPHPKTLLLLALLLGALLLSGCVTMQDPEGSQTFRGELVGRVSPGHSLGQTFVSRRAELNSVEVWLTISQEAVDSGGELTAALYPAQPGQPIAIPDLRLKPAASLTLPLAQVARQGGVVLQFPPLPGTSDQAFYLLLTTSAGEAQVVGRSEEAYAPGQLYYDHQPLEGDLAFRLSYNYGPQNLVQDTRRLFSGLPLAIPLLLALWLPGRVLLGALHLEQERDWGERLALSVGLTMAVVPVTMAWTSLVGLQWSRWGVWVVTLALFGAYAWQNRARLKDRPRPSAASLALLAVFLFSLAVRLVMVRDLAAPAWVDSVHHTLLGRIIVEQGGFPVTYAPYLNISTAHYHAGFHSLLAVFHWLSGMEMSMALLLVGQVLNALAVPAVYLLTVTFTRSSAAGVAAGMVTGLLSPMPAYYTSWGRYTQLAGLLLIPPAFALLHAGLEKRRRSVNHGDTETQREDAEPVLAVETAPIRAANPPAWVGREEYFSLILKSHLASSPISSVPSVSRWLASSLPFLASGLVCAGLFLVHYRVLAFLGCLLLAYLPSRGRRLPHAVLALTGVTLLALTLTLPWWPAALRTLLIPKLSWVSAGEPLTALPYSLLTTALGKYVLALAPVGLVWGLIQRRWFLLVIPAWMALLLLLSNLGWLGLPGSGLVNNTSVFIALFMPLSVLCGYVIGWIVQGWTQVLPQTWRGVYSGVLGAAAIAVSILGARALLPLLNPTTFLFRAADRPALAWIDANLPPEATVLVNPLSWGYGVYAGSDGGYWITPLTGRPTLPPPVIYTLDETSGRMDAITQVAEFVTRNAQQPAALHDFLLEHDIHYIYIGVRGGPLSPHSLASSSLFRSLYAENGTWVFEVMP